MKKGIGLSTKSAERIDIEFTEEVLSESLPERIKLTCKMVGDKPPIIWDDSQSVWVNLLANIGFLHEDQYTIVGDDHKELSNKEKDRLKMYIKKMKSLHPEQIEGIRKIPMNLSFERLQHLNSFSGGLPRQVEKVLSTLANHRRDGSPDHLCAILQYAVQKSTDRRLGEKQKAIKDRVELPEQLENSQIEEHKLLITRNEIIIRSLTMERHPEKSEAKKRPLIKRKIAELEADNARLEVLLHSPNPAALPQQEEAPVKDASWVKWAAKRYNKVKDSAVKLVEYADSLLQAPVDTEALHYIGTHTDDLVRLGHLIKQAKHEFKSMTFDLDIVQKKIAQEKEKKNKLTADIDTLDQLQFELSLLKVPSASPPEKSTTEAVVTVGHGKNIGWVEGSSLCENVQRLLEEYLASDRYRTRDRLKSAKSVLEKIKDLAEKDPLERDKALLDFIRLEQPKIASHGLIGKSSRLYGIYQQAEIRMRSLIDSEFADINELNHENKETKKALDISTKNVDRLKRGIEKLKTVLKAAASMSGEAEFMGGSFEESDHLADNDQSYHDLKQKNHDLMMKYFESSQDEAIKRKVRGVVEAKGKNSETATLWAAKMGDLQHKISQANTELEVLKAENTILENRVCIRYLEASKKSRVLNQGELFKKRSNHAEIDSTLLVMYVEKFLARLKALWGWGPELPKTQRVSPPSPNSSDERQEIHEPELKRPRYK